MKTPKEDYQKFVKECKRLQVKLGLIDWRLDFFHSSDHPDSYASIGMDLESSIAAVHFNTEIEEELNLYSPKRHAQHEMAHLLIGRLSEMAKARYITEEVIDTEVERIVHVLQELIK